MLEWIWFIALMGASVFMGRLSAGADRRANLKARLEQRQRALHDNAWGTAAHATMVVALYLSWPVLGLPVMDWMVSALGGRTDMLADLTVISLTGVLGLAIVALPVFIWIAPDIARELTGPKLTH